MSDAAAGEGLVGLPSHDEFRCILCGLVVKFPSRPLVDASRVVHHDCPRAAVPVRMQRVLPPKKLP